MRMILKVLLLAVAAGSQPGCYFFQEEYYPGLDPEVKSLVFVDKADANTLILNDGGSVTLATLDVEGMCDFHRGMLAKALGQLAPCPAAADDGKAHPGLLVGCYNDPKEVQLSVPYENWRRYNRFGLSMFPIRIPVPPTRVDLVECILKAGLARLNPKATMNPDRAERYANAEAFAKTIGWGVWAPPGEQLLQAVRAGNTGEVKRLLQVGAPVGHVGKAPLDQTNVEKPGLPHTQRLNYILWRNRGLPGHTPMSLAVQFGRLEIIQILLRNRADPTGALLMAAQGSSNGSVKRLDMIKTLVDAGADVRAADARQRLIVLSMFNNGQGDLIDYLHARGASIEAFDPKEDGPDLLARVVTWSGPTHDVERLIGFGADVNGLNDSGVYPLSMAVEAARPAIAKLLLHAGADPNRKDKKGKTPLRYAERSRQKTAMLKLLKQHGAQ